MLITVASICDLETDDMDEKYYKQQIEILRKELKLHESECERRRSLITKYTDKIKGFKAERRESSALTVLHKLAREKKKRDVEWVYNMLKAEKRPVKTGELCDMLNNRLDQPATRGLSVGRSKGVYNSMSFATTLGKYFVADERFDIQDARNDDNQKTKSYGLVEWKDDI